MLQVWHNRRLVGYLDVISRGRFVVLREMTVDDSFWLTPGVSPPTPAVLHRSFEIGMRGFRLPISFVEDLSAKEVAAALAHAGVPPDLEPRDDFATMDKVYCWPALRIDDVDDYEWIFDRSEFEPV